MHKEIEPEYLTGKKVDVGGGDGIERDMRVVNRDWMENTFSWDRIVSFM